MSLQPRVGGVRTTENKTNSKDTLDADGSHTHTKRNGPFIKRQAGLTTSKDTIQLKGSMDSTDLHKVL